MKSINEGNKMESEDKTREWAGNLEQMADVFDVYYKMTQDKDNNMLRSLTPKKGYSLLKIWKTRKITGKKEYKGIPRLLIPCTWYYHTHSFQGIPNDGFLELPKTLFIPYVRELMRRKADSDVPYYFLIKCVNKRAFEVNMVSDEHFNQLVDLLLRGKKDEVKTMMSENY
jgi:hypothetical protein